MIKKSTDIARGAFKEATSKLPSSDLQNLSLYSTKDTAVTKKGDFFDWSLYTYKNLQNKKNVLFIKYEDFVSNPSKIINKIYTFLNIPKYKHSFDIKNQFSINNIKYDDSIIGADMHKLHLGKVKNFGYPEIKLPKYIVEKYKGVLYEY